MVQEIRQHRATELNFAGPVEPLLGQVDVEFIGEIREGQKQESLGSAAELLFPIAWREPFGLVMFEAITCGAPVIAFENGSVPEVLEDAVTGFIVHSEDQAIEAVRNIGTFDRARIRGEMRAPLRRTMDGAGLSETLSAPHSGAWHAKLGGIGRRTRLTGSITGYAQACYRRTNTRQRSGSYAWQGWGRNSPAIPVLRAEHRQLELGCRTDARQHLLRISAAGGSA